MAVLCRDSLYCIIVKMIGNVSDWLFYAAGALINVADSAGSTVRPCNAVIVVKSSERKQKEILVYYDDTIRFFNKDSSEYTSLPPSHLIACL